LAHAAVARDFGYVLTLGDRDAWRGFTAVLRARLAPEERAELARAAVLACDDEDVAVMVAALTGCDCAGPPIPAFDRVAEEAENWAACASDEELRAYAVACFLRMSLSDRGAFLAFATRRAAA
jgi:hypothetical protein